MDQFIQLEHVDLTDLKPLSVHHWGMTVRPADAPPPRPSDPVNGFGVVFAIGPLLFWLFGHNLRGHLYTSAGSDDAHVLIWPALGNQVLWPPRDKAPVLRVRDGSRESYRRRPRKG